MGGSGLHQQSTNHHEMVRGEMAWVPQADPVKHASISAQDVVTAGADGVKGAVGLGSMLEPSLAVGVPIALDKMGKEVF